MGLFIYSYTVHIYPLAALWWNIQIITICSILAFKLAHPTFWSINIINNIISFFLDRFKPLSTSVSKSVIFEMHSVFKFNLSFWAPSSCAVERWALTDELNSLILFSNSTYLSLDHCTSLLLMLTPFSMRSFFYLLVQTRLMVPAV